MNPMDNYFNFESIFEKYKLLSDFFYSNMLYVIIFILGLSAVFLGLLMSTYKKNIVRHAAKRRLKNNKWLNSLDTITAIFPLSLIKNNIKSNLALNVPDEFYLNTVSNIIVLSLAVLSLLLIFLLKGIGQLWYAKLLLVFMSLILPYYIVALLFDLYRYHVNKQIPKMIDEFRSAFIKHRKVRLALKECSMHIDRSLGRIISKSADSTFIEESLGNLRSKFNNIWLNIFVVLLLNYKENGGELIDQLYRLNKTMTRYGNVEKKKNKRLIWYELFAVSSSIFSIPVVLWLNSTILGSDSGSLIDAQSNIIVSKVIGFSILSLVVIRVLRRL